MIPVTEIYGRKASDGQINWITAIAMGAFHVGAVVALFRAIDVLETPADTAAFWWHLLLWDPWWMLGGALFSLAALNCQRR